MKNKYLYLTMCGLLIALLFPQKWDYISPANAQVKPPNSQLQANNIQYNYEFGISRGKFFSKYVTKTNLGFPEGQTPSRNISTIALCRYYEVPNEIKACSAYRANSKSQTYSKAVKTKQSFFLARTKNKLGKYDVLIFANLYEGYLYGLNETYNFMSSSKSELIESPRANRRALALAYNFVKDYNVSDYEALFLRLSKSRVNQIVLGFAGHEFGIPFPNTVVTSSGQQINLRDHTHREGLFVKDKAKLKEIIFLASRYGIKIIPAVEHPGKLFKTLLPYESNPKCYAANKRSLNWGGCSEIRSLMNIFIHRIVNLSGTDEISIWNDEGGVLIYAVRDYMDMVGDLVKKYNQNVSPLRLRYLTTESTRRAFNADILPDMTKLRSRLTSVDLYDGYTYKLGKDHKATYNLNNYQSSPVMINEFKKHNVRLNLFSALDRSQWFGVPVPYYTYMKQVGTFMDEHFSEGEDVGMTAYVASFINEEHLFWYSMTSWYGSNAFNMFEGKDLYKYKNIKNANKLFVDLEAVKSEFLDLNLQMFRVVNAKERGDFISALEENRTRTSDVKALKAKLNDILSDNLIGNTNADLLYDIKTMQFSLSAFEKLVKMKNICQIGTEKSLSILDTQAREEFDTFLEEISNIKNEISRNSTGSYWHSTTKLKLPYYYRIIKSDYSVYSACP